MGRHCIELLNPQRYGCGAPGPQALLANVKLLWPENAADEVGEETPCAVALVYLRPTGDSRALMALHVSAILEGEVTITQLDPAQWAGDFAALARGRQVELLDWVLMVPEAAIADLAQMVDQVAHVPGVGQSGLAGACMVVTDRPDLIDHARFEVIVSANSNDLQSVAARVFRMLCVLTASYTISCLDFTDIAYSLSEGKHIELISAYWDDAAQTLLMPDAAKATLAKARGLFWADHTSRGEQSIRRGEQIAKALTNLSPEEARFVYQTSVGQRADSHTGSFRVLDVLVSW